MEKRLFFDTEKRQYLTSKVNSLGSLKLDFIRTSEDIKEKLPIKNDDEEIGLRSLQSRDPLGGV